MYARDEDGKCLVGEGAVDRGRGEALAAALMARVPPASGVCAGARCGVLGCSRVFIVSTLCSTLLQECVCRKCHFSQLRLLLPISTQRWLLHYLHAVPFLVRTRTLLFQNMPIRLNIVIVPSAEVILAAV